MCKKILKAICTVLLVILTIFIVAMAGVFVYHRIMLQRESAEQKPLGQKVEVDGHDMNVYTEGDGEHTLVFMSGAGIASPIIDYKSVYRLLSDDYKIVVLEKFGYGYSDIIDGERTFDTILRQDREALAKAGISGPYMLCPHSMSGLEAILWAQHYPEEVEAIIGLDMSVPQGYAYDELKTTDDHSLNLLWLLRESGILRLALADSSLPETYSADDKKIYRALACRNAGNETVDNEKLRIAGAIDMISSRPTPDVPMLLFVSDGSDGTGMDTETWRNHQREYASDLTNVTIIELDCGHMIHHFESERIGSEMRAFIEALRVDCQQ